MSSTKHHLSKWFSAIAILAMVFTNLQPLSVSAQGGDGIKRQVNAESGRVSFIGPASGRSLSAVKALGTSLLPQNPGLALAKRFAPEFGVKNPERDLSEMKSKRSEDGRRTVRYQQKYQGIPVMGGELIVNTNDKGDLYSMNGEVSPDLSLAIQPTIDSAHARETALQAVAKWYERDVEDLEITEPELWIYDESLLQPSTRPAELVWRMEVTAKDTGMPLRELMLINAERGNISLHFNQVDMAWTGAKTSESEHTVDRTILSSRNPETSDNAVTVSFTTTESIPALSGATWYVATTGNDANNCTTTTTPCATINGAIGKATDGNTIYVVSGTYTGSGTEVVLINKSVTLSGGWNAGFTTQSGMSTIDGQEARGGINVMGGAISTIEYFTIQNGVSCFIGGIAVAGGSTTLTLNNSAVISNHRTCTGGGSGIYSDGATTINNSTISDNTSGGVRIGSGTLTLNNSTISGNYSDGHGGGLDNSSGIAILNNSTVSGNSVNGNGGGGIFNHGTLILKNSTVILNHASNSGGGGILNDGTVTIQNTILALNTAMTGPDCTGTVFGPGTINSSGYNLIGNNSGCTFTSSTGDLVGTSTNPIDPVLAPLQNNGGSTMTHALYSISSALNTGNPAIPGSSGNACLGTDQRGVARPVGGRCDIGAYEGSIPWATPPYLVSTYTAGNTLFLPGTFLCNQNNPYCVSGDSHAQWAHRYAIGTYNLYATEHGRNSIDNNGMTIISTVHYDTNYNNAFWNSSQMLYGDKAGFPLADDVVAHELTHGVTQYESSLFYYYQSGAINEAFSDLWGEYYDQTNGLGNDLAGVKWLLGEDVGYVLRSMSNPPTYGDPDKMSSTYYYKGTEDNGGVHYNSGINNKAVNLMVDGGWFNGKTITALGWHKVGAIYYETQTNLLSSGADYSDLYFALRQACTNLLGQHGITSGDCIEVQDALDAVEMNGQLPSNFSSDAPTCTTLGTVPNIVLADDLESGTGNWTFNNGAYTRWQVNSSYYGPYAQSGLHSLYADDSPAEITDATATLKTIVVPTLAYLHFAQAYDFEKSDANYDGGVLEYSTNGGVNWSDAGSLIEYNGYTGTIYTSTTGLGNPLAGQSAFVGASHGYISTRLNLSSLAGQAVNFRWRMGLDPYVAYFGWWVDNVKIYKCSVPTMFADVFADYWAAPLIERLYNAGVTSGCSANPLKYCPATTVTRDQMAVFLLKGKHNSSYAPPTPTGVFLDVPMDYWAASWIEQLAAEGITAGCGGGKYCPATAVTRDQMAVFLLKAKHGSGYVPPAPTGVFTDVPTDYWAAAWIEQLAAEGITAGCGGGNYCPTTPVTRDQMAVFLVKNFNLP